MQNYTNRSLLLARFIVACVKGNIIESIALSLSSFLVPQNGQRVKFSRNFRRDAPKGPRACKKFPNNNTLQEEKKRKRRNVGFVPRESCAEKSASGNVSRILARCLRENPMSTMLPARKRAYSRADSPITHCIESIIDRHCFNRRCCRVNSHARSSFRSEARSTTDINDGFAFLLGSEQLQLRPVVSVLSSMHAIYASIRRHVRADNGEP